MTSGISTRTMSDDDLPQIAALLTSSLGGAPGGVDRAELFAWKHLRNPFGRSIALVAEREGEIVGLRSFMRWRFNAPGDTAIDAVRAVDTATAPSARRRGIFERLTREAIEICTDQDIGLVFNTPNDKSRPGYLKMGWREVATWRIGLRVRRASGLLKAAITGQMEPGSVVMPPHGSSLRPAAEVFGEGSAESEAALHMTAGWPAVGLSTMRTPAYLRWRYADGPIAYHVLDTDGARLVVRLRSRGALRELVVCEAWAAPGKDGALRALLRSAPKEAEADHAVAHLGHSSAAQRLLITCGYLPVPRAGIGFTVLPIRSMRTDPAQPGSWSLTLGDLEVF